jgi:hypothetical protein
MLYLKNYIQNLWVRELSNTFMLYLKNYIQNLWVRELSNTFMLYLKNYIQNLWIRELSNTFMLISPRSEVWVHKTSSLTMTLFSEVLVP